MTDAAPTTSAWHAMFTIGTIIAASTGGAIWFGALSNQISVNTRRLENIESQLITLNSRDADMLARLRGLEHGRRIESPDGR